MHRRSRRRVSAVLAIACAGVLALAASAGATTFCVPGFDPARCPDDGQNVAQADLEIALQSDASDGVPDEVVVAPGTYTDPDSFSPSGTDPLTIEGAGVGGAADPEATRLTTSSSANIYVVNLAAAMSRPITVRDLTVVVPPSLPDLQGAAMQVGGDTLQRVDIEVANPGSSGIPSWPTGGSYLDGTIYPVGAGSVERAIATGISGFAGPVAVEDATLVEPVNGIWAQHHEIPVTVERSVVERPQQVGLLATESGQLTASNGIVVLDGGVLALLAHANSAGSAALSADQMTLVQEGTAPASIGVEALANSSGEASALVGNSIIRGFGSSYSRSSSGAADADLTIRHSNLVPTGPDAGPGALDIATGNIDADPLFAGAVPYESPVELALQPGSPSIDAGDPAPGGAATDFLGGPRPLDGDGNGSAVRDQGAFEAAAPPPPAPEPPAPPAPAGSAPAPGSALSPPTGPQPSAADREITVRVLGKRLRVNRRGIARLRLRCPAGEASPPCRGRLVLRTKAKLRTGKGGKAKRRVVLARAGFKLGAGRTKALRLRLRPAKQRLLQRNRRARKLQAIVRARDGAGNRAGARKALRAVPQASERNRRAR